MNKNGAIAIFVKTPGLSAVKTRLAHSIGEKQAREFFEFSTAAIEEVVSEAVQLSGNNLTPYWAVAEEEGIGNDRWRGFANIYVGNGGLGKRLHHIYTTLLNKHDFVLLIGGDSPQITPIHLLKAAELLSNTDQFVIGPASDGGFYLFGGNKTIEEHVWTSIPYSVSNTLEMLLMKLGNNDGMVSFETLLDVDTISDLKRLRHHINAKKLPKQKKLCDWLETIGF